MPYNPLTIGQNKGLGIRTRFQIPNTDPDSEVEYGSGSTTLIISINCALKPIGGRAKSSVVDPDPHGSNEPKTYLLLLVGRPGNTA